MTGNKTPQQKIFFGPPGCGKSYRVRVEAKDSLGIDKEKDREHFIETTFHPEYSYGDFVAKLLPQTVDGTIQYHIHAGPLIKALALAYAKPEKNVVLVIDEINRGNCAQIFGDIFQLLDRDECGWSQYGIDLSQLSLAALREEMGDENAKQLDKLPGIVVVENKKYKLRLPPNLSIFGTMNTSDESVYYMDTAFKRRWDFKYMPWDATTCEAQKRSIIEGTKSTWHDFVYGLNKFICTEAQQRVIDDKQIGIWFIKANFSNIKMEPLYKKLCSLINVGTHKAWVSQFSSAKQSGGETDPEKQKLNCTSITKELKQIAQGWNWTIPDLNKPQENLAACLIESINSQFPKTISSESIKNKLMFFLWDNVFSRNRDALFELLKKGNANAKELRTFGEFADQVDAFIDGVMKWSEPEPSSPNGNQ